MSLFDLNIGVPETGLPFLAAMATPSQGANPLIGLLPMVAILGIFYFIILRPMKKRQEKVQAFIQALKVGDKIITSGGIHGRITRAGDTVLQVEIAERVRIEVSRNAIVGYQGQEPVAGEGQGTGSSV
jgi:preprotein translocase subunit YajC